MTSDPYGGLMPMWMNAQADTTSALLPTWIEAVATVFGVLVAVVAIVFTYKQIRQTAQQMRGASAREAQDSEDRTRPHVGVDVVPGLAGAPSFDLVIENHGKTTARHVRLNLVDDELRAQSESDQIGPALARLFGIGFDLAPGARRRVFWRLPDDGNASPRGDRGAPVAAEIAVTYHWAPGDDRGVREYKDRIRYDLTEYAKLTPQPTKGATSNGSSTEALGKNAVHALRAIAEHVAEIRR